MKKATGAPHKNLLFGGLLLLFVVVFLLSFYLGRYPIATADFFRAVASKFLPLEQTWSSQIETILFKIRFPRVIMAAVIGGGLAVAGAVYQALFQNPMVSQDILGASQGAAFGAAVALFCALRYEQVIGLSFICGLLSVGAVLLLNKLVKGQSIVTLVLLGMTVGTLFSSAISFLKLVGDPTNTLPAITYWLMGSLSSIKNKDMLFSAPIILAAMVPIVILRWRLNIIALGEEEALSLGVDLRLVRVLLVVCATLITAAAVSVSGLIGWVGLIVPHFARLLFGSDYRRSLPAAAVIGGIFLLVVDDVARLATTSEIPLGILTAFIGAPIFVSLLLRNDRASQ